MSSFKLAKKDAVSDTRTNIDYLHNKKLEYFESEKKNLKNYINELNKLKSEKQINNIKKIDILETKIDNINNDNELNNYLLDFFALISETKSEDNYEELSQKGKMDTFINSKINNSKIELYNNYITLFDDSLTPIPIIKHNKMVCKNCGSDSFIYESKQSAEICSKCGNIEMLLSNENEPSYSSNIEKETVFNYKRNNHFQECLNQLQAKENTTIPTKIIEDLNTEFKKYNITDPKLFTISLVKSVLKKLKYNKYYEHIPTIINQFCGLKAPKLTPDLEQQLKIMFDEIQIPFEKYSEIICPARKNFLNYNYVFYKMCELLNKDEFLSCFPLLKSREKLYEHDQIWKGICNDLYWEFIASI